jgi:hypothetical protein
VGVVAIRSIRTKSKHVICADLLGTAWVVVRIHTVVLAEFAEATMVIRAWLMLL